MSYKYDHSHQTEEQIVEAVQRDYAITRAFARFDILLIFGAFINIPFPGWYLLPFFVMLGSLTHLLFAPRLLPEAERFLRRSITIPPRTYFRIHARERTSIAFQIWRWLFGTNTLQTKDDCAALSYPFVTIIKLPRRFDVESTTPDMKAHLLHELGHAHQYDWFLFAIVSWAAAVNVLIGGLLTLFYGLILTMPNTVAYLNAVPDFPEIPDADWAPVVLFGLWTFIGIATLNERSRFIRRRELIADSRASAVNCEIYLHFLKRRTLRERYLLGGNKKTQERNAALHPPFSQRMAALTTGGLISSSVIFRDTAVSSGLFVFYLIVSAIMIEIDHLKFAGVIVFGIAGLAMIAVLLRDISQALSGAAKTRTVLLVALGIFCGASATFGIIFTYMTGFSLITYGTVSIFLPVTLISLLIWVTVCSASTIVHFATHMSTVAVGLWGVLAVAPCFLLAVWTLDLFVSFKVNIWAIGIASVLIPVTFLLIFWLDSLVRRTASRDRLMSPDRRLSRRLSRSRFDWRRR